MHKLLDGVGFDAFVTEHEYSIFQMNVFSVPENVVLVETANF